MKNTKISNIQLGLFVMIGLVFLVTALYLIGSNRNLFNKTFEVSATFYNVDGLTKGNNVRFAGIDVGTISRVEITSDTSVRVSMIIETRVRQFIKKTSVAAVGTDGLMGNKLVNITNLSMARGEIIEEGDVLATIKPVETDEMMRTLEQTNKNLFQITMNLKKITQKVENSNSLWSLLTDSTMAENVRLSVSSIRTTTKNTEAFTRDLNSVLMDLKRGKGVAGTLLYDTLSSAKMKASIQQLQEAGDKALQVSKDMKSLTEKIKAGEGAAGLLLSDTTFAGDLRKSMHNIQQSTDRFNLNMEAMKHNFLFRGYFKDQEKALKKAKKEK
jgi:phospholipid/cholesterol/gamma-HCH transport system substrate-binding protein